MDDLKKEIKAIAFDYMADNVIYELGIDNQEICIRLFDLVEKIMTAIECVELSERVCNGE